MSGRAANAPRNVTLAVQLLYVSAALVLLLTVATRIGLVNLPSDGIALIVNLLTVGLLAFEANRIAARRNWARWLFVAIFVFGTLVGTVSIAMSPEFWRLMPPIGIASGLLQTFLQTTALVLIFTSSSNRWFRAQVADESAV